MGKSKDSKGKGKAPREPNEEELYRAGKIALGAQNGRVGQLPPSDSESESEPEDDSKPGFSKRGPRAQNANVGMMPPSDSDSEDGSGSSSDEGAPPPEYLTQKRKPAPPPQERTAEQIAKDMERLELIRKKREEDRMKRIEAEGWDRFAPISETNKPPGHYVPPEATSSK